MYANGTAERLCGRTALDLTGLRFRDLLTMAGGILYETQFMPALRLQSALSELFLEVVSSSGTRTPVLASAVFERESSGSPVAALIVLFEAKQRRQYEKELLAARKEFEQVAEIVSRSSDAIIRLSPERLIQSWNDGAKQIFSYIGGEVVGQPFGLLLTDAAEEEIGRRIEQLGAGADTISETLARRKDGSVVHVSIRLTSHIEPPGKTIGFSAIIRDITSRKITERALMQADKLASVGRLASSIAHEINNPLAAVTNLLYLLENGAKDEETRSLVATAQSELARVSHLATHTLRFHRQLTKKTKVDVGHAFKELTTLFKGRFTGSGITALSEAEGTPLLECYESELRQVLVKHISNSFDAMRHGGRLLLRGRKTRSWPNGREAVRISVADDGSGISPEACLHLFEPFSSTKGINGAGLGLWISKDLVERNGGSIRVRSSTRPDAHGTIVSIIFPLHGDENAAVPRSGGTSPIAVGSPNK